MRQYLCLDKSEWSNSIHRLVPIRDEDKLLIMQWRNEQIYHLRQAKPLTEIDQENYFNTVVSDLFLQERPNQLLFSYLENDTCIGYGGLVHINWLDRYAEISFVMNTELEKDHFELHWGDFLALLEKVAFEELKFNKIFTYAYDLRQNLFNLLVKEDYIKEAHLQRHTWVGSKFVDVFIHSKFNHQAKELNLRPVRLDDLLLLYKWVNDPHVRKNSLNSEPIELLNHVEWFSKKVNDIRTRMFILEHEGRPVGQIRIDFFAGFWEIDYSICNESRGQGFGKKIVSLLMETTLNKKLKAHVKKENEISMKVFKALGFEEVETDKEISTFILLNDGK